MKIEKLPSGSYRLRKTYHGQAYTVVVDHKPTRKEAIQLMAAELDKIPAGRPRITFATAAENYIQAKANVLSPSTIKGYRSILAVISPKFSGRIVGDITAADVQREINRYSKDHAPKSVRNLHGFISAVLGMYAPNTQLHTTLPQRIREEPYIPTDSDIQAILTAARGSKYESALLLAVFGLRRSELCALTPADIEPGVIHVNKSRVYSDAGEWVVKRTTKTEESTRDVYVPEEITERILAAGLYTGCPDSITRYLHRLQDELGIPRFGVHKLRHYYASVCHALGIPDSYIMASGGWKSDNVLKSVYRHALADKVRPMAEISGSHIASLVLGGPAEGTAAPADSPPGISADGPAGPSP